MTGINYSMSSNSQQINKSSLFSTPLQLLITSWLILVTLGGATILCGCTAPEPKLLFDTEKVIATIFGDPLSLYAECDLADPVMNMNNSGTAPQTDLGVALLKREKKQENKEG